MYGIALHDCGQLFCGFVCITIRTNFKGHFCSIAWLLVQPGFMFTTLWLATQNYSQHILETCNRCSYINLCQSTPMILSLTISSTNCSLLYICYPNALCSKIHDKTDSDILHEYRFKLCLIISNSFYSTIAKVNCQNDALSFS